MYTCLAQFLCNYNKQLFFAVFFLKFIFMYFRIFTYLLCRAIVLFLQQCPCNVYFYTLLKMYVEAYEAVFMQFQYLIKLYIRYFGKFTVIPCCQWLCSNYTTKGYQTQCCHAKLLYLYVNGNVQVYWDSIGTSNRVYKQCTGVTMRLKINTIIIYSTIHA